MHRDLKLENIMIHFPDDVENLLQMPKGDKKLWWRNVDLESTKFEIKIADFGLSKLLSDKNTVSTTSCGTPLYMAP